MGKDEHLVPGTESVSLPISPFFGTVPVYTGKIPVLIPNQCIQYRHQFSQFLVPLLSIPYSSLLIDGQI
ncbi:hypothetical protein HanRHA438_Chr12g0571821 [Helianthus annuus]|nr:hypothetical protein HanHA300_Chr12g0459631 [Helianthus annuus]KAJ0506700.1 hypothetical protein HanHA89_Chr12g0485061 [Helianthus annuus]KAJ0676377.1 hypothetical protein HanLR1_Chr12g0462061 [Helianthus annuus]KAJ0868192.1 hypothetical protein HanRHA438_Chr12g0571821 [Helianthus annuus]